MMSSDHMNSTSLLAGNQAVPNPVQETTFVETIDDIQIILETDMEPGVNFTAMIALQPSTNILVPIIMFAVGMVGNIIAAGVYHCSSSWHRYTAFYGILRGFFITNIIGYLSVYPLMIAVHVKGLHWIGGSRMCDFHGFVVFTFVVSLAYFTGVLGFERFLAACRPATYNSKVEPRKVPFVLVLLWLVSVFTGVLPLVGFGRISLQYPSTWCFIDWRNEETVGRLFSSVLATIVVSVILLVIVSIVAATAGASYRTAKNRRGRTIAGRGTDRGSYRLASPDDNTPPDQTVPKRYNAADRALLWATFHYDILACGFLVCYIPVVTRIVANVSGEPLNNFKNLKAMHWAEIYPAFCPWLYVLLHEQIWLRLTCREPPYRSIPYSRTISSRRRNDSRTSTHAQAHDDAREVNSNCNKESVATPTCNSNHVNVVMHAHGAGYAVGNQVSLEPNRPKTARKKLDFIKESDATDGHVPHRSDCDVKTSTTSSKIPTTRQEPNQPSFTSPVKQSSHSAPQKKRTCAVITNNHCSNGPVLQNHVNPSSSTPPTGNHSHQGNHTSGHVHHGESFPLVNLMEEGGVYACVVRKESSI